MADLNEIIREVSYQILPEGVQLRLLQLESVMAALKIHHSIISMKTGGGKHMYFRLLLKLSQD